MRRKRTRAVRILMIGSAVTAIGGVCAFASIVTFRQDGISQYIGLRGGPAQVTGQAFETSEGRIHRAYNLGADDEKEYNMFVGPMGRPIITVNIPNNQRLCGPPSTVQECQDQGWTRFDYPTPFSNQGACVAYVNHRARVTVLVPEDALQ